MRVDREAIRELNTIVLRDQGSEKEGRPTMPDIGRKLQSGVLGVKKGNSRIKDRLGEGR